MAYAFNTDTTSGKRQVRIAFQVAPSTMDGDDFESLFADSIGPPWMGMLGRTVNFANIATAATFDLLAGAPIRFKARRRFRENDSTLFMVIQNLTPGVDTDLTLDGMVRTLIRIP